MISSNYTDLIQRFGPVKWVPGRIINLPDEGWFLLEITPCPPTNDIEKVISDIYHDRIIRVRNGRLYHSEKCTAQTHRLPRELSGIVSEIKEETFTVAVYPGLKGFALGQPIAIVLNQPINYGEYPDHPHINLGGYVEMYKNYPKIFLPDSLCYGFNQVDYRGTKEDNLYEAFVQISMWLFRHQVWCATRAKTGRGIWIGLQEGAMQPEYFPENLNPLGKCRCGGHKSYADCHMPYDYSKAKKCSVKEASAYVKDNIIYLIHQWNDMVSSNQKRRIELLNSRLIQKV